MCFDEEINGEEEFGEAPVTEQTERESRQEGHVVSENDFRLKGNGFFGCDEDEDQHYGNKT